MRNTRSSLEWDAATKRQLLHIAMKEDCSLDDKYAALRELQIREWKDTMIQELVTLFGRGMSPFQIAIELGIEKYTVMKKIKEYGLRRQGA